MTTANATDPVRPASDIENRAGRTAYAILAECEERYGVDIRDPCVASDLGWGLNELAFSLCSRAEQAAGCRMEDDPSLDLPRWLAVLDTVAAKVRTEVLREAAEYAG